MNGRDCLRRSLAQEGIELLNKGKMFLHISDYEKAQMIFNEQLDFHYPERANSFLDNFLPGNAGYSGAVSILPLPLMAKRIGNGSDFFDAPDEAVISELRLRNSAAGLPQTSRRNEFAIMRTLKIHRAPSRSRKS